MYSLNRAQIIGNLTRDPESRTAPTGQVVCNFGVATSSQWTNAQGQKQEKTEFHNIVAWAKLAEICQQYLSKGRKVFVEGKLQTREWDAQDGSKKSRTEIVADNVIILDKPGSAVGRAEPVVVPMDSAPSTDRSAASVVPTLDRGVGDQEIRIEDIPF